MRILLILLQLTLCPAITLGMVANEQQVVAAALAESLADNGSPEVVHWESLWTARRSGLPTLVMVTSPTCPSCRLVERRCMVDSGILKRMSRFICVRLDHREAQSWNPPGVPALILVSPQWKILERKFVPTNVGGMIQLLKEYEEKTDEK